MRGIPDGLAECVMANVCAQALSAAAASETSPIGKVSPQLLQRARVRDCSTSNPPHLGQGWGRGFFQTTKSQAGQRLQPQNTRPRFDWRALLDT